MFLPSRVFCIPGTLWQPRQTSFVTGCAHKNETGKREIRKTKKHREVRSLASPAIEKRIQPNNVAVLPVIAPADKFSLVCERWRATRDRGRRNLSNCDR